jgi:hypothetical protein
MSANRPIPAMYQGVSQQPAAHRALEQCEALENGYVNVADGARKRPPTEWVKRMTPATPINAKIHQYFRGDGEHNVILICHDSTIDEGQILAFNGTTGAPIDIGIEAGTTDYIDSLNAMDDIGCLTVADTTYIWNRTVEVDTLASTISAQTPRLFIYVKEGLPNCTYSVTLTGVGTATFGTGDTSGARETTNIAQQLSTQLNALTGFVASRINNLITVQRSDSADFTYSFSDSAGDSVMYAFKNRVERYSDLPRSFIEGATVEVRGQGDGGSKGAYWVKFVKDAGLQTGYWEETVKPAPGEPTQLDPATLPLKLTRQPDGTFQLTRISWSERLVGTTSLVGSAELPSFVGGKISSMFFYRNRLGFLSGENIVLSRANSLHNFFPRSVALISDDDPIDVTANGTKVTLLRHAKPFQRQLMLFSDNAQFPLTGGEVLSPKNVRADSATEYDCSSLVEPVSSGNDLFFVFERDSAGATYSGVREYTVNQTSTTNEAVDVTAHIPSYIPRNVHAASASSTEDLLLLLSKDEWNAVFFYKYLWSGDKKVQSAWGRWSFRPSDKVLSAEVYQAKVHLVIQRGDGIHLENMNLQRTATTGSLPFVIHLDSLAQDDRALPPAYDAILDETTLWKPYDNPDVEGGLMVVAGPDFPVGAGSTLPIVGTSGSLGVKVKGNWTAHPCYMGVPYTYLYRFSEQFMRDSRLQRDPAGALAAEAYDGELHRRGVVLRRGALAWAHGCDLPVLRAAGWHLRVPHRVPGAALR